jgi:SAM-dependent methyltransferase
MLDPEGAHMAALHRLADFHGRRVLELGCGDGRLTVPVSKDAAYVLAFDPDEEAVDCARDALPAQLARRVEYRVASGAEIEVERRSFDLALFSWSLCCVEPDEVVLVLRNMVGAVQPGGLVLDLQVIRPNPVVESSGIVLCEIDGQPLFRMADAAAEAVDAAVTDGSLVEEARDDHDVRKHYASGAEVVDDFAGKKRSIPADAVPHIRALAEPCAVRERCRLRRLRVV